MPNVDYQIVRTKKITSSVSIKIKNGEVIVSAPFWVGKNFISNFVDQKKDWILTSLQKSRPPEPDKKYTEEESHLLFGELYPLRLQFSSTPTRTSVNLSEDSLLVYLYQGFTESQRVKETKDALLRFYLEKGIEYLTEKVNYYTKLLGVDYNRIDIKKVSSIWGSCSAGNALSFNRKLVQAPPAVVDYVVIHEVCHLRERNHSSRFWGLVFKYDRDYKHHRRWLHQNHHLLIL